MRSSQTNSFHESETGIFNNPIINDDLRNRDAFEFDKMHEQVNTLENELELENIKNIFPG